MKNISKKFSVRNPDLSKIIYIAIGYFPLNYLFFFILGTKPNNIYNDYRPWAELFINEYHLGTRYPPLHTLWSAFRLSLTELSEISYFTISIILYFPIFCGIFFLLRKISSVIVPNVFWQNIASFLFIFYPLSMLSIQLDLSLVNFTLFFLLSLFWLIKFFQKHPWEFTARPLIFSAFFMGIAALIRPNPLLVPVLMIIPLLTIYFNKRAAGIGSLKTIFKIQLVFFIVFAATISPWSVYASQKNNSVVILSTGFLPTHRDGLRRFPPHLTKKTVNPHITSISSAFDFHLKKLKEIPIFYIKVWLLKIAQCWYGSDSNRWNSIFLAINLPYLLLGAYGFYMARPSFLNHFSMFFFLYQWFLSTVVLSIARYQTPIMAIVSIYAALGLKRIIEKLKPNLKQID